MGLKTNCAKCGANILLLTATKHGGIFAPCALGTRAQIDANRARTLGPKPPPPARVVVEPNAAAIIATLESVKDAESTDDLSRLDGALNALPLAADRFRCIPALLGLFERFPWSDGFESFWGILHALEKLPGYESELIASVRRTPGEFNLSMINRLLNGGISEVKGESLLRILHEIANAKHHSPRAKAEAQAQGILIYQNSDRRAQ